MGKEDLFRGRFKKRDEYKDTKDGSSGIIEDPVSIGEWQLWNFIFDFEKWYFKYQEGYIDILED